MQQGEQTAKVGQQGGALPHIGSASTGILPVTDRVITNADPFLRWWRKAGRTAQLHGKPLAVNPFRKAALSPYGRRCAAEWLRGFKAARAEAKRVRLSLSQNGQTRRLRPGK